jgi:hypothetical protein
LFTFFLLFIISSCQLEGDKLMNLDENFHYPLEVGNRWEYSTQNKFFNPRPDSIISVITEPSIYGQSEVTISKQQILDNSVNSYCFRQHLKQGDYPELYSEAYYNNQPEGLYLYAYRGTATILPRQAAKKIRFKNRTYNDIRQLVKELTDNRYFLPLSQTDSLNYEYPPLRVIAYPFKIGSEWIYRYYDPILISKKIDKSETLETPAGTFFTYRVQWFYDLDSNGKWDDGIHVNEYYSGIGLVKRSFLIQNVELTTKNLIDIGLIDYSEEYELINYKVK